MANAAQIDALVDKIAAKLDKLVTLTITTVVSPLIIVEVDASGAPVAAGGTGVDWTVAPPPAGAVKAWTTEINLLDGKIRDTLTQDFVNGDLASLADFHKSQVQQAKDIVHGNIDALIGLAKTIKDFI